MRQRYRACDVVVIRPLHPARFFELLSIEWPGVLRAKGFFWLATRMSFVGLVQRAGGLVRHEPAGVWWAATPKSDWPKDVEVLTELERSWDPRFGDRQTELVVIGRKMQRDELIAALDACRLTDRELGDEASWTTLPDPFPPWQRADPDDATVG